MVTDEFKSGIFDKLATTTKIGQERKVGNSLIQKKKTKLVER